MARDPRGASARSRGHLKAPRPPDRALPAPPRAASPRRALGPGGGDRARPGAPPCSGTSPPRSRAGRGARMGERRRRDRPAREGTRLTPRRPPGCPARLRCSAAAELSLLRGGRGLGSTSRSGSRGASRDPGGGERRRSGGRAEPRPSRRGLRSRARPRPPASLCSASQRPVGAGRSAGATPETRARCGAALRGCRQDQESRTGAIALWRGPCPGRGGRVSVLDIGGSYFGTAPRSPHDPFSFLCSYWTTLTPRGLLHTQTLNVALRKTNSGVLVFAALADCDAFIRQPLFSVKVTNPCN